MALVNRQVLLEYDVAGPRLWHERQVMLHIQGDLYVVLTPDGDIYSEELGLLNSDLRGIRVRPGPGVLPAGIVAAEVYGLPVFNAGDMMRFRDEAQRVADQERGAVAPVVGAAGVPAAVQQAAVVAPASGPVAKYAAGVLKWLAAECHSGYSYGQEVTGVVAALAKGAKEVHVQGNVRVFIECVDGEDLESFMQRPSHCDHRILPQVSNALGQPERSLKEVATACNEVAVKWTLQGPRTSRWCVNYLAIEGLGFEGHHERLRTVTKADSSSWGIQEHFQVSMSLRQALLVDQLDGFNLLSVEVQFRRLQTIEFSYAEKAREMESKAVGGRLSLEEQTTFGGLTRQFATLMVCPDLLEHVKAETEKEASLAKNLRKAREERENARKSRKGKQEET